MFSNLLAGSMLALNVGGTLAAVSWAGVNIAGFDFGCATDVSLPASVPLV